jgi:hypothetical protein
VGLAGRSRGLVDGILRVSKFEGTARGGA